MPPANVAGLLSDGVLPYVRLIALDPESVCAVQKRAGELALAGGVIYDFYHLAVAEREDVERFYTFNTGHFRALASTGFAERIAAP